MDGNACRRVVGLIEHQGGLPHKRAVVGHKAEHVTVRVQGVETVAVEPKLVFEGAQLKLLFHLNIVLLSLF